jgi:beta-lactamase class A
MKIYVNIFVLILAFYVPSKTQQVLPIMDGKMEIKKLTSLIDPSLQKELEKELNSVPKWKKLIDQKKMAVGLIDLRNVQSPKYGMVNGNHMMYAASLPKIAILLAAMDAFESGDLIETPEIKSDLSLMISHSNNQAATRMIDRLSFEKIEEVLTDDRYKLYDEDYGGLWVGKRYATGGDTHREPLQQFSHAATANQVCRFYYLLAYGKLVNPSRSKQMLKIMEDPALHHKFVNTLDEVAPKARLFRKSGSWRSFHSDSVLVWGKDPKRRYVLVALIDDENGEQIIRKLVRPIERVLNKSSK